MSSSASRVLPAAFALLFPISCASAPENLFTNGGSAGRPTTGGFTSTGGRPTTGGALNTTGGTAGAGAATGGISSTGGGGDVATGGTPTTGGADAATGGTSSTAGAGGSVLGGGGIGGGIGGQVTTLNQEIKIASPADDCTWINGTSERLRFSDSEPVLEVGSDGEMGRIGLRFSLPIASGARISSAILRIYRVGGDAAETDTLAIQVFDAGTVPPFDATHQHDAAGHVPGGLWSMKLGGMPVGKVNQFTQSPDLTPLVQHVLDRSDWLPGAAIGFVIAPDSFSDWASYADSASGGAGMAATLRVSYVPR